MPTPVESYLKRKTELLEQRLQALEKELRELEEEIVATRLRLEELENKYAVLRLRAHDVRLEVTRELGEYRRRRVNGRHG